MSIPAWIVAAALCGIEWYAVWRGDERTRRFTKPAATTSILVAALLSGLPDRPWFLAFAIGLLLGLLGDVLLLGDSQGRFLGGLGAFLAGHVAYLVGFVQMGLSRSPWHVFTAAVLIICLFANQRLLPTVLRNSGWAMAAPVAAYMLVIGVFAILGGATGRPLIALGAALFVVSDSVLANAKFIQDRPRADLVVMVTYLLAQAAIMGGAALTT